MPRPPHSLPKGLLSLPRSGDAPLSQVAQKMASGGKRALFTAHPARAQAAQCTLPGDSGFWGLPTQCSVWRDESTLSIRDKLG